MDHPAVIFRFISDWKRRQGMAFREVLVTQVREVLRAWLAGAGERPAAPNRTPDEWLGLMHDQLLAQSAVDRLTSTCHELVIEGDSYRKRQRPRPGSGT